MLVPNVVDYRLSPVLSARSGLGLGYATVTFIIIALVSWGATVPIASAVVASGTLQIEHHSHVVQHPVGGVVRDLNVRDGDVVQPGDILFTLDDFAERTELARLTQHLDELSVIYRRLEAEIEGEPTFDVPGESTAGASASLHLAGIIKAQANLLKTRQDVLAQQEAQIGQQIAQIAAVIQGTEAQKQAVAAQRHIVETDLRNLKTLLSKGLTQSARVSELEREEARLAGRLGQLTADIARARAEIARLRLERLRSRSAARENVLAEARETAARMRDMESRQKALHEIVSQAEVRARTAGVIHGSRIFAEGAVVSAAETVMLITPTNQPFLVAANVPPSELDRIRVGQEANLRFPTSAIRRSAPVTGRVSYIAAEASKATEMQKPLYLVHVTFSPKAMDPDAVHYLRPGLPVEVHMTTENRTALSYLLKPLLTYVSRAFREP